jgi:hypothetical protein
MGKKALTETDIAALAAGFVDFRGIVKLTLTVS